MARKSKTGVPRVSMVGGTRTITHTPDGREIIERQHNAPWAHPRWRDQQVPTTGLNLLLLADETETYECDSCGYVNVDGNAVRGHMSTHNGDAKTAPDYPVETLRRFIRVCNDIINTGGRRGYATRAASALNDMGLRTINGQPWNQGQVSRLYMRWHDDPRVKIRRSRTSSPTTTTSTSPASASEPTRMTTTRVTRAMHAATRALDDVMQTTATVTSGIISSAANTPLGPCIAQVMTTIEQLRTDVRHLADTVRVYETGEMVSSSELADLREKAQRWDDLRASLK